MNYCGIDLHSDNSYIVISDETDRVLYARRHANDLEQIGQALTPYHQENVGIVVESTYNWYWLVDGLQAQGYTVHLANTAAIKQYEGLKHRGDHSDAAHLAHLLRLGLLRVGHIMPKDARAVRDLARKRMQLVQARTTQILAIETILAREQGRRISSNAIKRLQTADLDAFGFDSMTVLGLKAHLRVMHAMESEIDQLEQTLAAHCRQDPGYRLLKSVPGIGDVLATAILLETGAIERFAAVGHYASYSRCVGSKHVSNGKKKGEGNTKNGNPYLAWAYVEAANFAIRYCEPARKFYQRKKTKCNSVVAIKATAHKLARACYHILKEGKPFDMTRCFT